MPKPTPPRHLSTLPGGIAPVRLVCDNLSDYRDSEAIEHSVNHLIAQRVYGLTLGYEDLNDHDQLRHDPLLGVLVGKQDPTG